MTDVCPRCSAPLPLKVVERVSPLLSRGYGFECPTCGARLIHDYWNGPLQAGRFLFAAGAGVLAVGMSLLGTHPAAYVALLLAYVAVGWSVFSRRRRVIRLVKGAEPDRRARSASPPLG